MIDKISSTFSKIPTFISKIIPKLLSILLNIFLPLAVIISAVFLIKALISLVKILRKAGYLNRANIILLFVVFVFLLFVGGWTSTINSCSSCHLMKPEGLIWRQSAHRGIPCYKCHRDKGAIGAINAKLRTVRMIGITATGKYSKPIRSYVPDARCKPCHKYEIENVIIVNKIKVKHDDFVGKTWNCTDCHIATAHGAAAPLQNPPIMTRCIACHDGEKASSKCNTCHTDDIMSSVKFKKWDPWQRAHGQNWQKQHGVTDRTVCNVCHKKEFCSKCHIQMPHPEDFEEFHGKESDANGNTCLKCHTQNSCNSCHKVEVPHTEQFKRRHAGEVKLVGEQNCYRCHLEDNCEICHIYHKEHPKDKKSEGSK